MQEIIKFIKLLECPRRTRSQVSIASKQYSTYTKKIIEGSASNAEQSADTPGFLLSINTWEYEIYYFALIF